MKNGPFKALQDISLFDYMTGKTANPVLLKLALRKNRVAERLDMIKGLPLIVIDNEPTWENGINVSGPDLDQEIAFNVLAQKLEYDNKWPLELSVMNKDDVKAYYIRTGI